MVDPLSIELTAAATSILSSLNKRVASYLIEKSDVALRSVYDQARVALTGGFKDYFINSFQRCSKFKSVLDPNVPLSVTDKYVNVRLRCGRNVVNDTDLISGISSDKPIVVVGSAGSGKTMFMRYMTLTAFFADSGPVPIFVELRHINNITNKDLITFIRSSASSGRGITEEQFTIGLKKGCFKLILDGWDELALDLRKTLEQQILHIRQKFPLTPMIISSRPDNNQFASW